MSVVVASSQFVKDLKSFGRLPKQFTVKVKETNFRTDRTNHYALVKVSGSGQSVTVAYEVLRKLMERLDSQQVAVRITPKGLHMDYHQGYVFLKHLGEWEDIPEVNISA